MKESWGRGPVRAVSYSRVSSKEQVEGYSLDYQRAAISGLCHARGYDLVADYIEEGKSAFTDQLARRPAFASLMAAAEARQFDVIVVHKMDRFARKLKACLEYLETLGKMQIGVVSVSEPDLDYSTPQGFLFLSMLGALSEWYSRNLSTETKKGWAGRKQAGLYAGRLPFGAMKGPDGSPIPDPATIDGLRFAFERADAGLTDLEVAHVLNAASYRPVSTAAHAIFSRDSVRTILANRFYVGELPIGKRGKLGWVAAKHAPLVDLSVFDRVQARRQERAIRHRVYHVPSGTAVHALTGLVICGLCGEPMQQDGRAKRLSCRARRQGRGCEARSVAEWIIEDELGVYLSRLHISADATEQIIAAYSSDKPEIADDQKRRRAIEGQLKRLSDLYVMSDLPLPEYERRRNELKRELSQLALPETHGRADVLEGLQRYLEQAGMLWSAATAAERNAMATTLFESVTVLNQQLVSVQPRAEYQPYFTLADMTDGGSSEEGAAILNGRARGDSNPEYQDLHLLARVSIAVEV